MKRKMNVFGLSGEAGEREFPVRAPIAGLEGYYSEADPDRYWDPILVSKMMRFMFGGCARNNVLLFGDAGCGKTSFILGMAALLGQPVFSIACSKKTRVAFDMIGERRLSNGSSTWQDGPLTMAFRYGGVFLANEISRLDENEQMVLAEVLDSKGKLFVPGTGETLVAHPDFRFAATGNSAFAGDETGCYPGERRSSVAFADRFQAYEVRYPLPVYEEKLLAKKAAAVPEDVRKRMVKLANEIRKNFVAQGGALSTVFSTRSLVVWAQETIAYKKMTSVGDCYRESLTDTVLSKASRDDQQVITELWTKWFNEPATA